MNRARFEVDLRTTAETDVNALMEAIFDLVREWPGASSVVVAKRMPRVPA